MVVLRALAVWAPMVPLAILNGAVRVYCITPAIGERWGHVVSSITLGVIIFLLAWFCMRNTIASATHGLLIGGIWVGCTVLFEFGFGHFVMGHPWEKLLADYNVFRGRVWSLVLLSEFVSPLLAFRLR